MDEIYFEIVTGRRTVYRGYDETTAMTEYAREAFAGSDVVAYADGWEIDDTAWDEIGVVVQNAT